MQKYKLHEPDFEVGDIVVTINGDDYQPYKVLEMRESHVGDLHDDLTTIFTDHYGLKIDDRVNSIIKLKEFKVGDDIKPHHDMEKGEWDVAYFRKLDEDEIESLIEYNETESQKLRDEHVRLLNIKLLVMSRNEKK